MTKDESYLFHLILYYFFQCTADPDPSRFEFIWPKSEPA